MKYSNHEITIYGSGQRGRGIYILLNNNGINVKHVIDTNEKKWNTPFYNTVISSPDVLEDDNTSYICIAIAKEEDAGAVRERIFTEYGIGPEREIGYFDLVWDLYQKDADIQEALIEKVGIKGNPQCIFECDYGLGLGGIEAWTKSICTELLLDGRENVQIISDSGEYEIPDLLEEKVVKLPIHHDEMFAPETMVSIIRYLMSQMPCVVVTGQFYMTLLSACLVKQHFPDQIHIISVIHFGKEELYRQYASKAPYVDLFIGVSKDIAEGLRRHGVLENKTDHMTCPVECDAILERSYTTEMAKPIKLGFAGRVNAKQKRMDLVPALVNKLDSRRIHYCFEIAGEGDYSKKLRDFVADNGLEERLKLIGKLERKEMSGFWKDKDICLSLSDYEGRSISIMEAMANGAVPVVTETSGVHEDITDGENGYIVGIGDMDVMAEKIAFLDCHRDRIAIMGQNAHAQISPKCQMSGHLHYWETLLDNMCGRLV